MNPSLDILKNARIAAPCSVPWSSMQGDERVRFCGHCQKNVYNFVMMTPAEAAALVVEKDGNLCARMYQRADGTMLAGDCPVGLRRLRPHFGRLAGIVAACLGFLIGLTVTLGNPWPRIGFTRLRNLGTARAARPAFAWLESWVHPPPDPSPPGRAGRYFVYWDLDSELTPEEQLAREEESREIVGYDSYMSHEAR